MSCELKDAREYRRLAHEEFQKNKKETVIVYLVYLLLYGLLGSVTVIGGIIIGGPMLLGLTTYIVANRRGTANRKMLFLGFRHFVNALVTYVLKQVVVALWSLLLIVPGIIKHYSYAMAFFLLEENPAIDPTLALKKSQDLMKGRKWKLFLIDVSYIGWILLSVLTLGILLIWVKPKIDIAHHEFYRRLLKEREEAHVETPAFNRLPFDVWATVAVFGFLYAILRYVADFLWTIIKAFLNIFIGLYKGALFVGKKLWSGLRKYTRIFIRGNWKTRLSFLFLGTGHIFNRQIVKGVAYLALEAGFVLMMIFFGWNYLIQIGTLGTVQSHPAYWDPDINDYVPAALGDNSMLILLFGVAVIMLIIAFLIVYFKNIDSAYENQLKIKECRDRTAALASTRLSNDQKAETLKIYDRYGPNSFKKDVRELFDNRFHITILTLPTMTAFAFTILPLIFMILIAFTNFDRTHQPPGQLFTWVAFDNFVNMFNGTNAYYSNLPATLWKILQWSLVWAVFATFLNYIFGMILALMINKKGIALKKMWRTIFVITIAVPQFISLLVVARILDDNGPIVKLLMDWGWVGPTFGFFKTGITARITVIVVNLWVGVPYTMLITSGILMNIPADLYESATIDGAGAATKFFKITLPYMLFVTGPYLVTAFIGNINNFNVIYFLTGGGPSSLNLFQAGETDLLVTWLFKLTVDQSDYKIASTLGILIFMISSFVSLVMFSKTGAMQKEDQFQ